MPRRAEEGCPLTGRRLPELAGQRRRLLHTALLATEEVELRFSDDAVTTIARMAAEINQAAENIGARRLHTVLERLLEELSFSATEHSGQMVEVTVEMVQERLGDLVGDRDLARYIL